MKKPAPLFYLVGFVAIVIWIIVLLYAAWYSYQKPILHSLVSAGILQPPHESSPLDNSKLSPGQSWMILRRSDKPIGFIHQTRTLTPDGWLLESDMHIGIELMGQLRKLQTTIKATLHKDSSLSSFNANLYSKFASLSVKGHVINGGIHISYNLNGNINETTLKVNTKKTAANGEPVLLLADVIPAKLAAKKQLSPGDSFSQQYFDPISMAMKSSQWTYIGPSEELHFFDVTIKGDEFRQNVAGQELTTILSDSGEVLYQRLPLAIDAIYYRADVAKALISRIDRQWAEEQHSNNNNGQTVEPKLLFPSPNNSNSNDNQSILQQLSKISDHYEEQQLHSFTIQVPKNILANINDFSSSRQIAKKVAEDANSVTYQIETDLPNEDQDTKIPQKKPTFEKPDNRDILLQKSIYIDLDNPKISTFVRMTGISNAKIDAAKISNTPNYDSLKPKEFQSLTTIAANRQSIANDLAAEIFRRFSQVADVGIHSASSVIDQKSGDCTEFALLLASLLRYVHIETRFAFGMKRTPNGEWIPHSWVQYWDGLRFRDADSTTPNLIATPQTVQFMVSPDPNDPRFATLATNISIHTYNLNSKQNQ